MKRYNHLFEKICSLDNILEAHNHAKKGKRHYSEVQTVNTNPEYYAKLIRNMLINHEYRVGEYDIFKRIVDSGKERDIYRLDYYPHRIIHHAILQIMEPIWVKSMISQSYCCIKGRGIHKALIKLKKDLFIDKPAYCLKLDIKKFYPNIDNNILKNIVRLKIKDKHVLWLLDEIIDSSKGLPIGNYMSQFFANLYLNQFDHWCKQELKIKHYYRYCDDIVILNDNKQLLHSWLKQIEQYLQNNLKLTVKENWQVFPIDKRGIDFLGYRFFSGYTLLRKTISKKVIKISNKIRHGQIKISNIRGLMSYYGWMIHCNSLNLRKKVFDDQVYSNLKMFCYKNHIKNPLEGKF